MKKAKFFCCFEIFVKNAIFFLFVGGVSIFNRSETTFISQESFEKRKGHLSNS
eukprot:UN25016